MKIAISLACSAAFIATAVFFFEDITRILLLTAGLLWAIVAIILAYRKKKGDAK
jgi:hypothetical protein